MFFSHFNAPEVGMPLIISSSLTTVTVILAQSRADSVTDVYIVDPSMRFGVMLFTPHAEYGGFLKCL